MVLCCTHTCTLQKDKALALDLEMQALEKAKMDTFLQEEEKRVRIEVKRGVEEREDELSGILQKRYLLL